MYGVGGRAWRRMIVPLLAMAAVATAAVPASAAPAGHPTHDRPGTLLSAVPVANLDPSLVALGAREWRVLYSSRSALDNHPIVVSGMVIAPAGRAPAGGWPVIAWAHGTTGVADDCAPSSTSDLLGELPAVLPLLQQGFVITATDYEGLGTPGPHPYLVPTSEGRGVIDSVRAARSLVPDTSNRWAAFGASQGGQAVWAANELARSWGGGLHFLGSASAAPAADITGSTAFVPAGLTPGGRGLFPLVLYGLKLQHPQLRYSDYLEGPALALTPQIGVTCATSLKYAALPTADFTPKSAHALDRIEHWLAENALPRGHATAPMFVAQGTADTTILPAWTDRAVRGACRIGDVVQYTHYAGAGHPALPAALPDIVQWLDSRFAGGQAPSNCAQR